MHLTDWAFEKEIPQAEKIVLVWLTHNAGRHGVGLMERERLEIETGYAKRSMQRLLKCLRDRQLLIDIGPWYRVGPFHAMNLAEQIQDLPEDMRPIPPGGQTVVIDSEADPELIGQVVADIVGNRIDALEREISTRFDVLREFHMEHFGTQADAREPDPPPPDPVLVNPLYDDLIIMGKHPDVAYVLSKADLEIDASPYPPPPMTPAMKPASDDYSNDAAGRLERIVDILEGAGRDVSRERELKERWAKLEAEENKHSVSGEPSAFLLLYPAIVAAAKANAGTITADMFIDLRAAKDGDAIWDRPLVGPEKSDNELMVEISQMISELEARHDPRCEVNPRTQQKEADGSIRLEPVFAYWKRVKAKHDQMKKLSQMGVFDG